MMRLDGVRLGLYDETVAVIGIGVGRHRFAADGLDFHIRLFRHTRIDPQGIEKRRGLCVHRQDPDIIIGLTLIGAGIGIFDPGGTVVALAAVVAEVNGRRVVLVVVQLLYGIAAEAVEPALQAELFVFADLDPILVNGNAQIMIDGAGVSAGDDKGIFSPDLERGIVFQILQDQIPVLLFGKSGSGSFTVIAEGDRRSVFIQGNTDMLQVKRGNIVVGANSSTTASRNRSPVTTGERRIFFISMFLPVYGLAVPPVAQAVSRSGEPSALNTAGILS